MPTRHSPRQALRHIRGIMPDSNNRPKHDFYRTPPVGTRRLLAVENFPGVVWEPACGDGAISNELKRAGSKVISSDLIDRGYGRTGRDFLTYQPKFEFDHIVTNPPFTHCMEFAERALSFRPKKVALLLRVLWLEGRGRRKFFETSGLTKVMVFSGRINVSRNGADFGDDGEGGMVAFAWYIWKRGHKGPPTLDWI